MLNKLFIHLVLIVWAGAIALFFNRWGKIRMLLPYQPDYKQEQLKVPGTGVCSSSGCNGQHSHQVSRTKKIFFSIAGNVFPKQNSLLALASYV